MYGGFEKETYTRNEAETLVKVLKDRMPKINWMEIKK